MFKLVTFALTAALAMASLPSTHAADPVSRTQGRGVHNVVLVHGAFADGGGWRGVHEELTARGYRVSIVQNPLTSLADDVRATQRVLDRQDGPAILVGHSWGGTVITEAGVHGNVAGLVYVSALAPDAGETTAQQYTEFAPTPEFVIETGSDGYGFISAANFKPGFAHDASNADAAFLRDSQVPINMSVFKTPLTQAAWRTRQVIEQRGRSAESVAEKTVRSARDYLAHAAPVGPHLADQLLLPMAFGGVSTFATCELTLHFTPNCDLSRRIVATACCLTLSVIPLARDQEFSLR